MHIKRCLSVKISQNRHFSLSWKPPVRRCLCICTCIVTVTLNWSGHMQKVAATSLLSLGSPTSPPQQHPLCSAGNVIKPWGTYQWCVVHNFLLSNCLGKPLPVLIDKVRPTGTVGGVPFWTVLNWCPVLLFSSLWTMWFMSQLAQESLRSLTSEANHWGMPWLEGCWKEKRKEKKKKGLTTSLPKDLFMEDREMGGVGPMISFSVRMCNCFSWLAFLRDGSQYEERSALPAP